MKPQFTTGTFTLSSVIMNRYGLVLYLCHYNVWTVCSLFLLLGLIPSCRKSGPTEPPPGPDTTSHNFSWQITTLGDGLSSSMLNDVAIINDTLVYAVGAIYLKDSTGHEDPSPYNVTIWNGNAWMITRATVNFRGNMINVPLDGVFTFSPTDIWLVGSLPIHGDGSAWNIYDVRTITQSNVSVEKVWGTDSRNMYFVGLGGSAVHYDGTNWQILQSGTTIPIQDIWGATNPSTGQTEILAIASYKYEPPAGKALLRIQGTSISAVSDSGLPTSLSGLWFYPGSTYFVVGDGLFGTNQISASSPWTSFGQGITTFYSEGIRGSAPNDIVVGGGFGELLHYNGATWHSFRDQIALFGVAFYSAAIKGNMIVAVGERDDGIAICAIGHR